MNYRISIYDYVAHGVFFLFYGIVKYFPSPIGDLLRKIVVYPFIRQMGKTRIYEGVTFWYPYRIRIGDNVTLNEWVYLSGFGGISIGDNVRIGHRTSIVTSDHCTDDHTLPICKQGLLASAVTIQDNVWIGCNVTILRGVTISQGAVVGAGAVVTKDVLPNTIVAGVPAICLRTRGQR